MDIIMFLFEAQKTKQQKECRGYTCLFFCLLTFYNMFNENRLILNEKIKFIFLNKKN